MLITVVVKLPDGCILLFQKDVVTHQLQEQNQSALQQLAEFVAHHIEAGPVVTRYLEEKGLVLPMSRSPGGSLTYSSSRRTPSSIRLSLPGPGIRFVILSNCSLLPIK